jgi:FkbM family methyltransferase
LIDQIKDIPHAEAAIFDGIKKKARPLALFGAGSVASRTLKNCQSFGLEPVCFCDNDPSKQGRQLQGLPILSHAQFKARHPEGRFLISSANMVGIRDWLFKAGEKEDDVIYFGEFRDPYSQPRTDYAFVQANAEKFEELYASLADQVSKDLLVALLNCKISGDNREIMRLRTHDQYFDKDLVKLSEDEVLVDAGAYTGDTVAEFVKRSGGRYAEIIALEPDAEKYCAISQMIQREKLDRVRLLQLGAWREKTTLTFAVEEGGTSSLVGAARGAGELSIQVDKIDAILGGRRASFIKMDIEGAERGALEGAEATIGRWAPRMAVSIYHQKQDLFDLPLLLKSYVPEYKFFIRNYTDTAADTVLYAIKP